MAPFPETTAFATGVKGDLGKSERVTSAEAGRTTEHAAGWAGDAQVTGHKNPRVPKSTLGDSGGTPTTGHLIVKPIINDTRQMFYIYFYQKTRDTES